MYLFFTTKVVDSSTNPNLPVTDYTNDEEKLLAFCNAYSFTERECDVMRALLQNNDKMQDIASMLFISRTALYRHVAQLNEKTKTSNRISLLQFYHQWKK